MFERYNAFVFSELVIVWQQMHVPDILACATTMSEISDSALFIIVPNDVL